MNWRMLACAVVATLLAASPALACKGKKVLFEDNFSEEDPSWDTWEGARVEGGVMRMSPQPGRIALVLYKADVFDKADICVDLKVPDAKESSIAGLVFAAENYDNFYTFWISPVYQTAGITRLSKKRWLDPVGARKVEGMNVKVGDTNTLRLTLNGSRATAYINDKKFIDFRINEVAGGGFIGLEGDGADKTAPVWEFTNLKVTDLP